MGRKTAAKSILLLWVSALSGAGLAFCTQVIVARQMGPSHFGIFSAALATVTLLSPLASFGVAQFWLMVFGREGWGAMRWLKGSFRLLRLNTFLTVVLIIVWALLGPNDDQTKSIMIILSIVVLGQLVLELVGRKLQLEERFDHLALWQLLPHIMRLLPVAVLALLYPANVTPLAVGIIYGATSVILFLVGSLQLTAMKKGNLSLKGHGPNEYVGSAAGLEQRTDDPTATVVFSRSWPYGLAGIFYLIYFQSDIILLRYMAGPEEAGIYNVAFVVLAVVLILPSVIYQKFMAPTLHRWVHHDRERLYRAYRTGGFSMLILGLLAMLAIWLMAPWGIPILFGADYESAASLLVILSFTAPMRFVSSSFGGVLATSDFIKAKIAIMGGAALFNIVLNAVFIPVYGGPGAAVVTVVTEFLVLIAFFAFLQKRVFAKEIGGAL